MQSLAPLHASQIHATGGGNHDCLLHIGKNWLWPMPYKSTVEAPVFALTNVMMTYMETIAESACFQLLGLISEAKVTLSPKPS